MGAGRPTTYKPEYCKKLEEHLSKGFSYATFGADINTPRETLYEWEERFPEFLHSKKVGLAKSQKFWENIGMEGMTGKIKNFNSAVWIFSMKNKFAWKDSQEVSVSADVNVNHAYLVKLIQDSEAKQNGVN